MSDPRAVLIGAHEVLPALRTQAGVDGEVLTFSDAQPLQALEAITRVRPPLVVLERSFAATPRGAALLNRLKADPGLAQAEIRVQAHDTSYSRVVSRRTQAVPASAPAAVAEPERPADWRGTRRAPRFRLQEGAELQIDGEAAAIVDLSIIGAQVLSPRTLRPNQRVRLVLADERQSVRFGGTIAWASFVLSKAAGAPRYRAGIEFHDADAVAVQSYCERYRQA